MGDWRRWDSSGLEGRRGKEGPGGKEAVGGGGLVRPEHTAAPFPCGSLGFILTPRRNRSGNMHVDIAEVRWQW